MISLNGKAKILNSDIVDDLYDVIRENKSQILEGIEFEQFELGKFEHEDLRRILKRAEYTDQDINRILVKECEDRIEGFKSEILDLEQKKLKNLYIEEVSIKL